MLAEAPSAVTTYAADVVAKRVPACDLVRRACARHLRDLEAGGERGLTFSESDAERAIGFFGFLRHSKGEWAGSEFALAPWQAFIVGSIFGWKRADGTRRFRFAYIEVPRKNGKSTLTAGIGLYLLVADDEPGAEVYTAATKRDQARIIHEEAVRMVKRSPELMQIVRVYKDNLHIEESNSKYEPLGADADTMDGLNVHGALIDELHAHKSGDTLKVLDTATGARRQPLIFTITTAGYDQESECWRQRDYAVGILNDILEDDAEFVYVATVDEGDDWLSEATWAKANPNLGVSVKLDDLRRKAEKAKQLPTEQNGFKQLHLNIWTAQAVRWMDLAKWDACATPVDLASLKGRIAYGGLDLSSTTDMAAIALLFPDGDKFDLLTHFWLPAGNLRDRIDRDRVPYDIWEDRGLMTLTPGDVIDYDFIFEHILLLAKTYELRRVGFDPYNALQLVNRLMAEFSNRKDMLVQIRQGYLSLSPPTKELQNLVLGQRLRHGGNPIMRWNVDNVTVTTDPAGNIKPVKRAGTKRIDGFVATVMATALAMTNAQHGSIYDTRGALVFG